jgi:hypothetical protein
MPFVPTAGRVAVFLLAGPSTGSDAGSEVVSSVELSAVVVCSEEEIPSVPPFREALSRATG